MSNEDTPDLIKFAKVRAKRLRTYLASQSIVISHSQSLEATAQSEGFKDWNCYFGSFKLAESAFRAKDKTADRPAIVYPVQVGQHITGTYRGAHFEGTLLGLEQTINKKVWRAKLHFDQPVKLAVHPELNATRQRVRLMLNENGQSVDLKGRPDGQTYVNMP